MLGDCPIQLAHGGGGEKMSRLLQDILPLLGNAEGHDSAIVYGSIAFTTDSYVVKPLEFPGGDIGELAVYGTANDLAMAGAIPEWLSLALILEEGFSTADLRKIIASIKRASDRCGVKIVTGDTKVVEHGKGDGLYINTSGIGNVPTGRVIRPPEVKPGDAVIVSGDLGRHGAAVMTARQELGFDEPIHSDLAPLSPLVESLYAAGVKPHCLRDLTRGGLASALIEIARQARVGIRIETDRLPISAAVRSVSEILGLDPLYLACEGRFVCFVPEASTSSCLKALGPDAQKIGIVLDAHPGQLIATGTYGSTRAIPMLSGEQLPRIC